MTGIRSVVVSALLMVCLAPAGAADELNVLPPEPARPPSEEMLRVYLRSLAADAFERRSRKYESLKTAAQVSAYQSALREFFTSQLGGFPERTPLNARVTGRRAFASYRVENIIYESRPGFFVTANLYLPKSEPPFPAVLLSAGHMDSGKAGYQQVAVLLAVNGIATLAYDPIGQGERKLMIDGPGAAPPAASRAHMIAGVAPILLGENLAGYMVWDGIRGIDYLVSRSDIDRARIGATGNSGGGMMTSYLMALDDRIFAAAPSCFITTTRRKNESPGPGDAEQNIHGQIAYGMDHADYILMRAPRPTVVLSATRDYVPIKGAWESFRQAKRLYTRLGYAERAGIVETDAPHGFSKHLREGAVRWMRRWLLHIDDAAVEGNLELQEPATLNCTPSGSVMGLPGARSIFDLYREKGRRLAAARRDLWKRSSAAAMRRRVRQTAGVRPLDDLPPPRIVTRGRLGRGSYRIDKLILRPEPGIDLPALLFRPGTPDGGLVLYLDGEGKRAGAGGPIEQFVLAGKTVLAVDLRGFGETATTPWRFKGALDFTGGSPAEFFIAYMLGKSLTGMRTEDTLTAARYLATLSPANAVPVDVVAKGEAALPALHAAYLEPGLIGSLTLPRRLTSWSAVLDDPLTKGVLTGSIHGALATYDIPELESLMSSAR